MQTLPSSNPISREFTDSKGKPFRLRDWREHDLEVYRYWMADHHPWKELDAPYFPVPSPEVIQTILEKIREKIQLGAFPVPRFKMVIADGETDRLVGVCSSYWQSKESIWLSAGIGIYDDSLWGQGIGYQALGRYCDHLWLGLPEIVRLDLRTWSGNTGMMRLAEKLGFTREATFRKARMVKGIWYDGIGYGVLREEWQARYPEGFAMA